MVKWCENELQVVEYWFEPAISMIYVCPPTDWNREVWNWRERNIGAAFSLHCTSLQHHGVMAPFFDLPSAVIGSRADLFAIPRRSEVVSENKTHPRYERSISLLFVTIISDVSFIAYCRIEHEADHNRRIFLFDQDPFLRVGAPLLGNCELFG